MIRNFLRLYRFSQLAQKEFLKIAEEKLQELASIAEKIDHEDLDVSSTSAILTVKLSGHTIVINTQTPNRQLWYSCTLTGPQRFNWYQGKWKNTKTQQLSSVLQQDINRILSQ